MKTTQIRVFLSKDMTEYQILNVVTTPEKTFLEFRQKSLKIFKQVYGYIEL